MRTPTTTKRLTAFVASLALAAGLLASCGNDDDTDALNDTTTTTTTAAPTTTEATTTTEASAPDGDVELVWKVTYIDEHGSPERALSLAVSPDGDMFASGHFLVARVHHLADGDLIDVLEYPHTVEDLSYTPDGSWLAGAATRGGVLLYDTAEPTNQLQLDAGGESRIAVSPDGQVLATNARSAGVIEFWSIPDGALLDTIERPDADWVVSLEYHPDGGTIAAADYDCVVTLFDVETGAEVDELEASDTCSYGGVARPFRFSPDGTAYARMMSEQWERRVDLVDAADQTVVHSFPIDSEIRGITFTSDASMIAIITQFGIEVWDTATGDLLHTIEQVFDPDVTDWNIDGTFTPDDGHLLIGRWDGVELWRLPGAEELVAPEREACDPVPIPGDVLFDTGSSDLRSDADAALTELAEQLADSFPDATLTFVGHTDSQGSADANQQLSLARATSTRDWFATWATDNGIDGWTLDVDGRGDTQLRVPDVNADGDFLPDAGALNRRVEIIIDAPSCASTAAVADASAVASTPLATRATPNTASTPPMLSIASGKNTMATAMATITMPPTSLSMRPWRSCSLVARMVKTAAPKMTSSSSR
ncbi:MAG: OmpA family protein [Acidimicrobiales bacterium]|nr:OmpA family protein [Acidimicrobiales bacterium]